jgi:uncharacterized protein (TIGR02597 family)
MYGRVAILGVGLFCFSLFSTISRAVDVYTDPVGFYKINLLTNSDTYISVPFTQIPQFQGKVTSISGSTINVAGTPAWASNQWATPTPNGYYPYYVSFVSGAKEGALYTITNNGAASLSVVLSPESLSGVIADDKIRIIPFWTLNTVFPGGTGVVATTSALSHKTEILFPNIAGTGINLSPTATYFFLGGAWRRSIPSANVNSNFNDVVILPDQYVVARQNNNANTSTNVMMGQVVLAKTRAPLYANLPGGPRQDNFLAIYRPAVQTLNQSGLSNVIKVTTSTLNHNDELLVFDNATQARNKSPSATYFYYSNGWRRSVPSAPASVDFGETNVFLPGSGFIVRRQTNTTTTVIWSNPPNYSNN